MNSATENYRDTSPLNGNRMFVTDGGLETVFVFQREVELPEFAAFHLLTYDAGIEQLRDYYRSYLDIARQHSTGMLLDTATWRASRGWGASLGYSADEIARINAFNVSLLKELCNEYESDDLPIVINGVIGPQDDGYQPSKLMDAAAAQSYHRHQVDALATAGVDMVTAVTMTYADEAIGIARAAVNCNVPVVISFTVETDGRLPDGTALADAIRSVDAATNNAPSYFMINCAHPSHFEHVLTEGPWLQRIGGVRANASCKSHAELDESTELDEGDPVDFGDRYRRLQDRLPNLRVVGGCCGTDHRHVGEVCRAIL